MDEPRLRVVETLSVSNPRSISAMLREAADAIDADPENPPRAMVSVVLENDGDVLTYGWGDTDDLRALGLLERGKHELLTILANEVTEF